MNRGYLALGLLVAVITLAAPELVAWVIASVVFVGALIWSAHEMRPAPHRRRIVGRIVRDR